MNPNRVIAFKTTALRQPDPPQPGSAEHQIAIECQRPYGAEEKHLLRGVATGDGCEFQTIEEYRAAWEKHRDLLLPEWIKKYPATRPAAWWICDCEFLDELPPNGSDPIPTHFGRPVPGTNDQSTFLELHGELSEEELVSLEMHEAA